MKPQKSETPIRLAVFDFDGVFTDNRVLVTEEGKEAVFCWRSDGFGLEMLRQKKIDLLVISTETNPVVSARCKKLRIEAIQSCEDKWMALQKEASARGIRCEEISYLGNDINDIECLKNVGFPACVSDSHPDALKWASYVTRTPGGYGAVREFCEYLVSSGAVS